MPELPEVETFVRALRRPLVGRTITGARNDWPRHVAVPPVDELRARVAGRRIEAIDRRGKYLVFSLSDDETLIIHLKMSGHLSVVPAGTPPDPYAPVSYTHLPNPLPGGEGIMLGEGSDGRREGVIMTMRISHKIWWMVLWLPLLLAACGGFDVGQIVGPAGGATATPAPALTIITDDGPTPTPAAMDETPQLMCTPPACAPGEGYACPGGDCPGGCGTVCVAPTAVSGPLAAAPTEWENLESWLATLWRGNMNPAAVRAALQQSGMQRSPDDWRAADFDGDLLDEWVVVLYDQSLPGVPFGSPGDLWVVNGDGVIFRYYTCLLYTSRCV